MDHLSKKSSRGSTLINPAANNYSESILLFSLIPNVWLFAYICKSVWPSGKKCFPLLWDPDVLSGGGFHTAFVHRGHQNQHIVKVPCSCSICTTYNLFLPHYISEENVIHFAPLRICDIITLLDRYSYKFLQIQI